MTVLEKKTCTSFFGNDDESQDEELEILNAIFLNVLQGTERGLASRALLKRFGGVRDVLIASDEQLERMDVLPDVALLELRRTRRILDCIMKSEINNSPLLDNLDDVRKYCRAMLSNKKREELHALFLDGSYYLLSHECLQVGTVNHVSVYPREIMFHALRQNASHLILIHNHPGGSEKPSKQDIKMTQILMQSASFLNKSILDHIIVGRNVDFSFRQNGMMTER